MGEADNFSGTVATALRRMRPNLSKAELKVAAALLSNYPIAGMATIATIAHSAGVSEPTVSRLVAKLGFDGFASFRRALAQEVTQRLLPPTRIEPYAKEGSTLSQIASAMAEEMMKSMVAVDEADFSEAVGLLCDETKRIFILGGRVTATLAKHLAWSLEVLRPGILYVGEATGERVNRLLDVVAGDLVVAFDFRRYQMDTVKFVERASLQGADSIVFTDPFISSAAGYARVVFHASVGGPSQFTSLVPTLAIVETLVRRVADRLSDNGRSRMERYVENSSLFNEQ